MAAIVYIDINYAVLQQQLERIVISAETAIDRHFFELVLVHIKHAEYAVIEPMALAQIVNDNAAHDDDVLVCVLDLGEENVEITTGRLHGETSFRCSS